MCVCERERKKRFDAHQVELTLTSSRNSSHSLAFGLRVSLSSIDINPCPFFVRFLGCKNLFSLYFVPFLRVCWLPSPRLVREKWKADPFETLRLINELWKVSSVWLFSHVLKPFVDCFLSAMAMITLAPYHPDPWFPPAAWLLSKWKATQSTQFFLSFLSLTDTQQKSIGFRCFPTLSPPPHYFLSHASSHLVVQSKLYKWPTNNSSISFHVDRLRRWSLPLLKLIRFSWRHQICLYIAVKVQV